MAGLADSASLGYGIGLGAEYKDKTNLVNQLEQNRLKRAQLEQPKAEKEVPLKDFTKSITIDSKWHRILVPKITKYTNEAANEANKLRDAQGGRITETQLSNIMSNLSQKLAPLNTTNDAFNLIEKNSVNSDWVKENPTTNDDKETLNFLHNGSLESIENSPDPFFRTTLGSFEIDAKNATISNVRPIPKYDLNKFIDDDAKVAESQVLGYSKSPTGQYIANTGVPLKEAQKAVYETMAGVPLTSAEALLRSNWDNVKGLKLAQISTYQDRLLDEKNRLINSGAIPQETTDREFLLGDKYAPLIDDYLINTYGNAINNKAKNKPKIFADPTTTLKNYALGLAYGKNFDVQTGQVTTTEEISQKTADDLWENIKNSPQVETAAFQLGGKKEAKQVFYDYLKPKRKGVTVRDKNTYEGGGYKSETGIMYQASDAEEFMPEFVRREAEDNFINAGSPTNISFEEYTRRYAENLGFSNKQNPYIKGYVAIAMTDPNKPKEERETPKKYRYLDRNGTPVDIYGDLSNIYLNPKSKNKVEDGWLNIIVKTPSDLVVTKTVPAKLNKDRILEDFKGESLNQIYNRSIVKKYADGGEVMERMFILGNKAFKESKLKDAGYDINTLEEYK